MSEAIMRLVGLAQRNGLEAEIGDWEEARVYWFDALMPSDVRSAGSEDDRVEHFDSEGTPHNPAGEGFIDRAANTAISFLLQIKEA